MSSVHQSDSNRYLVFKVGGELYATPLLDVREVVEYQVPKVMPNTVSFFKGVINIRGSIVGVVDLRNKLQCSEEITKATAMLVIDSEQGTLAVVVDQMESVASILDTDLEKNPPVMSRVEQQFVMGVAKVHENLITIIRLNSLISHDELVQLSAA